MYVIDTNSFLTIGHFFPERFPSFWERFNSYALSGDIISTKEVFRELTQGTAREHLSEWIDSNKKIFLNPTEKETLFVAEIFKVAQFRDNIGRKQMLKGSPVADPWIIASAKARDGCVVTEEKFKVNAAKVPNICRHFGVDCCDIETFMSRESWSF